jgi:hypothetical protein
MAHNGKTQMEMVMVIIKMETLLTDSQLNQANGSMMMVTDMETIQMETLLTNASTPLPAKLWIPRDAVLNKKTMTSME